jgi:hypothetical protein
LKDSYPVQKTFTPVRAHGHYSSILALVHSVDILLQYAGGAYSALGPSLTIYDISNASKKTGYVLGTVVDFSKAGKDVQGEMSVSGFSDREDFYTWTEGNDAVIKFYLNDEQIKNDLYFHITFGYGRIADSYSIYVNNSVLLENFTLIGQEVIAPIPKETLKEGVLSVRIHLDNPKKPSDINADSTDGRVLGIQVVSCKISG